MRNRIIGTILVVVFLGLFGAFVWEVGIKGNGPSDPCEKAYLRDSVIFGLPQAALNKTNCQKKSRK
jgi:hypothetical protein